MLLHLENYSVVPQADKRELQLVNSCDCGRLSDEIRPYFDGTTSQTAIDVVVGGEISGTSCPFIGIGGISGATCGPSNNGTGGRCGVSASAGDGHPASVVLLDGNATDRHLIAHELAHMMGLGHVGDPGEALCFELTHPLDTAVAPNNLATNGGTIVADPLLTANQCARVRCVAANWLEFFGRMSVAEAAVVCAE